MLGGEGVLKNLSCSESPEIHTGFEFFFKSDDKNLIQPSGDIVWQNTRQTRCKKDKSFCFAFSNGATENWESFFCPLRNVCC